MKFAFLCVASATSWALAAPELSSPLVPVAGGTEHAATFRLDASGYQALLGMDSVVLNDFVLADGVQVNLRLSRREAFSADAQLVVMTDEGEVLVEKPEMAMFGGYVDGDPESTVFLAFSPFGVEGYVDMFEQTWVISSGAYTEDLPVAVYNLTTLPEGVINWAEWQCNAGQLDQNMMPIEPQGGAGAMRGAGCFEIDFAVETDQEYLGLFGGNQTAANTYLATLFGAMTEIYTRDVNTTLTLVWTRLWTTADPWNSGNTTDQLFQYRDYWQANMGSVQRDLGHFISGRGLGGGVAWLPGICGGNVAYGLSANMNGFFPYPIQNNSSQNWDLMVVSHEIGHNVGAPHTHDVGIDGCANNDCSVTPNGTIMSYCHLCPGGLSNVRMEFHPNTINNSILPTLGGAGCGIDAPCGGITFDFPNGLPAFVQPNGSTSLSVVAVAGIDAPVPGTGMFHYDTGSGFQSIPMTQGVANSYTVNFPAATCGGTMSYYVSAEASDGNTYVSPSVGAYTTIIASDMPVMFADNFETNQGWTVANQGGLTDGAWERGVPAGAGDRGDPSVDYDGSGQCYLTGNRAGNSDVDGGTTILTSPVFDASGDSFVSYARWYSNTFGAAPNADIFVVEISNNGGSSWTNLETVGPSGSEVSGGWFFRTFRISDTIAPTSTMRVRFSASDLGSGSVVEAAVDAFQVFSIDCESCPGDWNNDGTIDFFDVIGYLADFDAGEPAADLNGDTNFDFFDVIAFLGLVSAGC